MSQPLTGYAGLLRALQSGGEETLAAVSSCLGYQKNSSAKQGPGAGHSSEAGAETSSASGQAGKQAAELEPIPFWRVTGYEQLVPSEPETAPTSAADTTLALRNKPGIAPDKSPLITAANLSRRLRRRAAQLKITAVLDVDKAVDQLSRSERLEPIPLERRRRWGGSMQIICDHSVRLTPYWIDQLDILEPLLAWFPKGGVELAYIQEGSRRPVVKTRSGEHKRYQPPPTGSLVIALTDLGCLDQGSDHSRLLWQSLGEDIRRHGSHPIALLPGGKNNVWKQAGQAWSVMPLEQTQAALPLSEAVEQVLNLCAFATRVQPGYCAQFASCWGLMQPSNRWSGSIPC